MEPAPGSAAYAPEVSVTEAKLRRLALAHAVVRGRELKFTTDGVKVLARFLKPTGPRLLTLPSQHVRAHCRR